LRKEKVKNKSALVSLAIFSLVAMHAPVSVALGSKKPKQATLAVEGMYCPQCPSKAEAALKKVPGVTSAKVDYANRRAVVTHDPSKVKIDELIAALKEAGFTASAAQAKTICPKCQATYESAGVCSICQVTLQPIEEKKR
jgi:copper chaperone CopZ